ncbi:MAG TPA: pentapeptide repeat-containing protein [Ktedonobacterales bacterium]
MSQVPFDPQPFPAAHDALPNQLRTADQLLAAYASGERAFANWNLAGVDLKQADLRDSNFYGADLSGADLSEADLTRCNFAQANLQSARLRAANISQAYLDGAVTTGADMADVVTDRPSPQLVSASANTQPTPAAPPAPPTTRFCIYCGATLPLEGAFCPSCGRPQPAPGLAGPPSVPLAYASPALPSTPLSQTPQMIQGNPPPYGAYGAYGTYAPPSMPLQPGPHSMPLSQLTQQPNSVIGSAIAAICGAIAAFAFFLPSYVSAGSAGASGPQVAGAFGTVASLCSQYSGLIDQSSSVTSACSFASIAGPALWIEMILAAVAAIIAGRQWYIGRQSAGLPLAERPTAAVLITGGISLLILVFQFLALPALLSAATGISAVGQAVTSAFGFGFWLMVLGTIGVVSGAIIQLRAS